MSEKTAQDWLNKYYPVSADDSAGSWLEAAEHSLRKWRGLTDEVLEEYGLNRSKTLVGTKAVRDHGVAVLLLDGDTCALCVKHDRDNCGYDDDSDKCPECPITLSGGVGCNETNSPYDVMHVPKMIETLETAVKWVKETGYE